ncbi:hypothetical protein [Actinospongicola halichondriae]|uniref:hypothetical protein n=1 Tax=Actinospongicola halichondriae TaxID=3236844 RepID=UPI003D5663E0
MIRAAALATLAFAVSASAGCSSGGGEAAAPSSTTRAALVETTPATAPPTYSGEGGEAFCAALRDADDRPVLDPFQAGLDAREVELRLRALVVRSEQLAAAAPPELADDVQALASGLGALDETLADHGYDFGAAGEAGADLSAVDAPEFVDIGVRVAAYRDQVCTSP